MLDIQPVEWVDAGMVTLDVHSDSQSWEKWDDFVRTSENGTVYHMSGWLKALALGMGLDIRAHFSAKISAIEIGVTTQRASRFGFALAHKPWGTAYNGPVVARSMEDRSATTAKFLQRLERMYRSARVVGPPEPGTSPRRIPGNWKTIETSTPLVDVRCLDRLWSGFDRRVRQRVRKASGFGVTVSESRDVTLFYPLYKKTYARQMLDMPIASVHISRTLQYALDTGIIRFYVARTADGDPAAALVVGSHGRTAYFMLAASHPIHRKTDAMTLLWWHVIQEYARTCDTVDLVGLGTPGIERFKSSFNPTMQRVCDLRYESGLYRLAWPVVERFRRAAKHFSTERPQQIDSQRGT
jgi:hypothetical protein